MMQQADSLQTLLHDSLIATGHVECSTIIKKKNGSVKASSIGFEVGVCKLVQFMVVYMICTVRTCTDIYVHG